jgi:Fe-coproporphyrin III synthase
MVFLRGWLPRLPRSRDEKEGSLSFCQIITFGKMIRKALRKANIHWRPQQLHFGPEWIVLGVNNLCNMSCKMCDVGVGYEGSNFYANLMGAKPLNMPLELATLIFEQAAKYFPKVKIGYAFTEPIIYPHLVASLAVADRLGLYTSMTTNALKLRNLAPQLAEAGLNDIFISLDGPPEVHNEVRGHRQSFEWAVEGMEKVFALPGRKPSISVFCTITEWNIGRLQEFLAIFKGMPLGSIGFMHTNFVPDDVATRHNAIYAGKYPATASNMAQIDLSKMDLDLLWREVQAIQKTDYGFPVTFSPKFSDFASLKSYYQEPEKIIGKVCNDAFRMMMIKSDGSVIPAHGRCYQHKVGNVYTETLPEIWNSGAFGTFRKDLMDAGGLLPACARCCSAF